MNPLSGNAYPQYYLAIKYILDTPTASMPPFPEALVPRLDRRPGRLTDAIRDSMGLSWEEFQRNVNDYSIKAFKSDALQDGIQDTYQINPLPQLDPHGYKR